MSTLYIAIGLVLLLEVTSFFWRQRRMRNAERMLRKAKQEAKDIAQLPLSNPAPLIQIAEDGSILFQNPAAKEAFPNLEEQEAGVLQGFTDTDKRVQEIAAGGRIYLRFVTQSKVGREVAYILHFTDITDLKQKETALLKAQKSAETARQDAERANQARGEFLANMSHELRTPMNGIIGLSDILREGTLPPEKKKMANAVHNSAKSLLHLLNDILDFSKIEAGELAIEHIPFSLLEVLEQIKLLHKNAAEEKNIGFDVSLQDNLPDVVMGDPTRLQQVLNNLAGNAIKFTEEGSVNIIVEGSQKDGNLNVKITVQDTGIGIPPEKQAHIFEKFQQAETATARKYGGTGLGLSITKDLVHLMDGEIGIESEAKRGTSFIVNLRLPVAEEKEAVQPHKREEGGVDLSARLLIVDDHPVNLLFLRQTLKRAGFQTVDEARSGAEAIERFARQTYDLIFMDCQMPEMDGFETTCRIRERQSAEAAPVIIAVTADVMKGVEEKCRAGGMNDYISKPVEKEVLWRVLQTWLPGKGTGEWSGEMKSTSVADDRAPERQVIDYEHFNECGESDAAMEAELIRIFLTNLKTDLHNLHHCFEKRDYEGWDEAAHKIFGASAHIGAEELSAACDKAQSLRTYDFEEVKKLHKEILQACRHVQDEFLSKLKKAA